MPRTAAAYLVSSWLILEVGHLLTLILDLPHWTLQGIFWLLVVGFPCAMGISWKLRPVGVAMDLPETEPASRAENKGHHGHGHGGHGSQAGEAVDPLPLIVAGLVLLALLFLLGARLFGFSMESHPATAEGPAASAPTVATVPRKSVAVLAFANLSGDARQDYFADGLSEEVLDSLADIRALKVAARTSSFSFKGKAVDAKTIGAKLGVAYVLDGSVRRDGDLLRVSAQLVDAQSGFRTWSERYDRRMAEIFAVQRDIADQVVGALKVQLGEGKSAPPADRTTNPQAYDNYLRARALVDMNGGEESWRSALHLFDAAISADPGFAAAHAGRARALVALANAFLPGREILAAHADALRSAQRAVAIAANSAEAQSTLGHVLFMAELDPAGAIQPFRRSIQLGPGDADVLMRYGIFATRSGLRSAEGIAALRKAVVLDPLNPRTHKSLALGLYAVRRYSVAIAAMREAIALSPSMTVAHSVIGDAALALGDYRTASREYQAEPLAWARLTGLAVLASREGHPARAHALLAQLAQQSSNTNLYQQAQILAQLGERDAAIAALKKARTLQDVGLTYLNTDPMMDPLRTMPEFRALQGSAPASHIGA